MDDLIGEFITETSESLAVLDHELVKLELQPRDAAIWDTIFRLVHTIKGTCGFLGLPRLESVAHATENLLARIRDGAMHGTPDAISIVLEAIGRIKQLLAQLDATGREGDGEDRELITRLNQFEPKPMKANPTPAAKSISPIVLPAVATLPDRTKEKAIRQGLDAAVGDAVSISRDVVDRLITMAHGLVQTRNELRVMGATAIESSLQQLSTMATELQQTIRRAQPNAPLAIQPVLLVETAGQRFAIPQADIVALVNLDYAKQHIETIRNASVLRFHGKLLPLLPLTVLLKQPASEPTQVVVLRIGTTEIGLTVDRILGNEEIVRTAGGAPLRNLPLYAGSTVLGDGSVVLMLDPAAIGKQLGVPALPRNEAIAPSAKPPQRLLTFTHQGMRKAVSLEQVVRIERVSVASIDATAVPMMHYHGEALPLIGTIPAQPSLMAIILKTETARMAVIADTIGDIIEAPMITHDTEIIDSQRLLAATETDQGVRANG